MVPILEKIESHQKGYSLPQEFYTSKDIFDQEIKQIWNKMWLFAGTTADIPNSGDYIVYNLDKNGIIIIRGNQGEVYAHHNTCRHRGSLICLENKGNTARLICPYHQWTFDKDGSLLRARLMPDDFCKEDHNLISVHCQVIEGFIFICLADDAPPIDALKKDLMPFLTPFKIDNAKVAHKARYELRTNWKLVGENFRECYHCGPAHPEYCSAVIGANMIEDATNTLTTKQPIWTSKGLEVNTVPFVNNSSHFAIRYPLRPGVESYSLDGKAICKPMGDHTDHDAGVLGIVVYPNFWMDAVADYMWTMQLTAVSPSKTIIDLSWLVDKDAVEGIDYNVERLIEFWRITGEQDWALCENNFKGIESAGYRPGPYSTAEDDVVAYVEWYLDKMRGN